MENTFRAGRFSCMAGISPMQDKIEVSTGLSLRRDLFLQFPLDFDGGILLSEPA